MKIQFEINRKKALESILYVAQKNEPLNIYNLMKIIFEADKYHLNMHGRPVTGDVYIHMIHGTVPSTIYDMVKRDLLTLAELEENSYPFTIEGHHLIPSRGAELKYFSETDIEALDHGIEEYGKMGFKAVEDKNHKEPCWLNTELNQPIPFEMIIENPEVLAYLKANPFKIAI